MATKKINWKLTIIGLAFSALFAALGFWQLSRAHQKEKLMSSFNEHISNKPIQVSDLEQPNDWRFYKVELKGTFDNNHTFLLDNKTYQGKVGYEIYTPFRVKKFNSEILIDRGFVPITTSRDELPTIRPIKGNIKLIGMINLPPNFRAMGPINDNNKTTWPLRVEYINLAELGKFAGSTFYPYVVMLEPKSPYAYEIEWHIFVMGPERHRGYAVQWFALALTLLILSVVLNRRDWRK